MDHQIWPTGLCGVASTELHCKPTILYCLEESVPEHTNYRSSLSLSSVQAFIEGHKFFEQYETTFQTLKQAADIYIKSDSSGEVNQQFHIFLVLQNDSSPIIIC